MTPGSDLPLFFTTTPAGDRWEIVVLRGGDECGLVYNGEVVARASADSAAGIERLVDKFALAARMTDVDGKERAFVSPPSVEAVAGKG